MNTWKIINQAHKLYSLEALLLYKKTCFLKNMAYLHKAKWKTWVYLSVLSKTIKPRINSKLDQEIFKWIYSLNLIKTDLDRNKEF